jgi:protein HIRA/HIR1
MDFSQTGVLLATVSEDLCAVAFEDCSVVIYSSKGRRLSSMHLPLPVCRLESYKEYLVAITLDGHVHRWTTRNDQKATPSISVLGLLSHQQEGQEQDDDIVQLWVHSNGLPIIITRSERAFTLDAGKGNWVMIASGWYADCSPIWEGRTRGRSASMDSISGGNLSQARKEPIRAVESEINDLVVIQRVTSGIPAAVRPPAEMTEEFAVAMTLKHHEMRLQAAVLLESGEEYKAFLRTYAKKLSDEGIRNQADDLCKSLLGPIYYTATAQDRWEPSICGMEKRALLSDILKVMAKGRLLLGLVQTYQDHLKNVSTPW